MRRMTRIVIFMLALVIGISFRTLAAEQQGGDNKVNSIEAVGLNQIKINFNTTVDVDSAEDVSNYKLDGTTLTALDSGNKAQDENGAVAAAIDNKTVLITFAKPRKQGSDVEVSVKKAVYTEDRNVTFDAFDQKVTFLDTAIPKLKNVTMEGNNQLIVEFSEPVNMVDMDTLKGKFKINEQDITRYGLNSTYSEIEHCIKVDNSSFGEIGTWANKVMFYLDCPIPSGSSILTISEGDSKGTLKDAAGFIFQGEKRNFLVQSAADRPLVKKIQKVDIGEVAITFDRPMDVKSAKDLSNYEINNKGLYNIQSAYIKASEDNTTIRLKNVYDSINSGQNIVHIKKQVKDACGNRIDDTKLALVEDKVETKPEVTVADVISNDTIRVKFSNDVSYKYATNLSNYQLLDSKGVDITNHIRGIYNVSGETDMRDSNTFDIKVYDSNPANQKENWTLTSDQYTLTVRNTANNYTTIFEGIDETQNNSNDNSNNNNKPVVTSVSIIDNQTIRVKFNKTVNYMFAENPANYKLIDSKDVNITNHIKDIYNNAEGKPVQGDSDTFYIKLNKTNPKNPRENWSLTAGKYVLTIKSIIDTDPVANMMDDYTISLNSNF